MPNNGSLAKRTKNPRLKLKILLLLGRGVNLVEAGVDVVDVAAQVVAVLQAAAVSVLVVAIATLTVPTLPVGYLHPLLQMVILIPLSRGVISLQSLALILAPAGAPLQRRKLEHLLHRDGPTPILPGVLIQLPMAQ